MGKVRAWFGSDFIWLIAMGLMLASSGIDGVYMAQWMARAWGSLGLVRNTVADVANLKELTTSQVAYMLGLTQDGARKLMIKLEQAGTPPITYIDGRWVMLPYRLNAGHSPIKERHR